MYWCGKTVTHTTFSSNIDLFGRPQGFSLGMLTNNKQTYCYVYPLSLTNQCRKLLPFCFISFSHLTQPVKKQSVTKELPELEIEDIVGPDGGSNIHIYSHPDINNSSDDSHPRAKSKTKNTAVSSSCSCPYWCLLSVTRRGKVASDFILRWSCSIDRTLKSN